MKDTTDDVTRAQINVYRRLDGAARFHLAVEMSTLARDLALARLRQQHPGWPVTKLYRELLRQTLLSAPLSRPSP